MSQEPVVAPTFVNTDRPIEKAEQDRLGRRGFASSIARQIRFAPRDESFVLALTGPWGSGKTSILNMIEEQLGLEEPSALFLRFNPWLFAGHQQLVAHFFQEIAAQLREARGQELREVWRGFEGYSRLLQPLRGIGALGDERAPAELSVRRQRKLLEEALRRGTQRLVIVIDDIDRLQDGEIRDVMRLVRLVADFPSTVYLLSYDQDRVEKALGGAAESGRSYLEKIVQIVHAVPVIRGSDMAKILIDKVNEIIRDMPVTPEDKRSLPDVFHQGIRPLFRGLRDVYRYANALRPAFDQIGAEVAVTDVLAMEALRITQPNAFDGFIRVAHKILNEGTSTRGNERALMSKALNEVFAAGGEVSGAVQKLLELVFPTIQNFTGNVSHGPEWMKNWRRDRRIVHPEVFAVYLARVLPEGALPTPTVRDFFNDLGNEQALLLRLQGMDAAQLEELLGRLEDYESEFPRESVGVAVKALTAQLPRMREGQQGILDFGADMALSRVVLRLLRRVNAADVETVVSDVLPRVASLSGRFLLVRLVKAHRLVEEPIFARLKAELAQAVVGATPDLLASERDLARLLFIAKEQDKSDYELKVRELVEHDHAFVRVLSSRLGEARSWPMGSVTIGVEYGLLWWDDLQEIVTEDRLRERLEALDRRRSELTLSVRDKIALDLGLRYLTGWRPKEFGQRAPSASESDTDETDDDDEDDPEEEPEVPPTPNP